MPKKSKERDKSKRKKKNKGRSKRSSSESHGSALNQGSLLDSKPKVGAMGGGGSVLSTANLQGSMMKGGLMGSRLMGSTLGSGGRAELSNLKSSQLVAKPNLEQSVKRTKPGPMLRPVPAPAATDPGSGESEESGQ